MHEAPLLNKKPRVSVIVPTRNRPQLLRETVESLKAQAFSDWEAIIVDDASAPGVALEDCDPRVRLVRNENPLGGAAAKNAGIAQARAELLTFVDDDDLLSPEFLKRAVEVLEHEDDLDVLFIGVSWFGHAAEWSRKAYEAAMKSTLARAQGRWTGNGYIAFDDRLLGALLKSVPMAFQRPVVRRDAMRRIGAYRAGCLLWDCDWAIRAAMTASTALLPDPLYQQRAEGQGHSSRADRRLDHLMSAIDMKARYLRDYIKCGHAGDTVRLLREAAAGSWIELAWHYALASDRGRAYAALCQSARVKPSLRTLKMGLRLIFPVRQE